MVPTAKRALSFEQIDAQTAVELPDRDMMALINLIIFDVASGNQVTVQVPIGVAANVCDTTVALIAQQVENDGTAECRGDVRQLPVAFQPRA